MVQGHKTPPGKMFQVKSDYPACFSLPLNGREGGGVLLWQQQVLERGDASNVMGEQACEDE